MKKYLLPEGGKFYKANLHCHTTVSDGKMTPEEIKKYYKENGYSVVAFTDHDVLVPHPELADEEFLPLNGYEMEVTEEGEGKSRKTCHMCLVALEPDNLKQVCYHRSRYLFGNSVNYTDKIQYDENEPDYVREYTHECISDMMKKGRENGFFVTYNHPSWSLENYTNYMGYNNMHAMEIYNNECINMGYCDYNEKEYDDMLRGGKRIYCLATDDCHKLETCCGGYIMIKADKLEYKTITNAMVAGNFYASYGPSIYKLWFEDSKIHIECSDAVSIKMNTARRCAKKHKSPEGSFVNGAYFDVVPEDGYVRITVVDKTESMPIQTRILQMNCLHDDEGGKMKFEAYLFDFDGTLVDSMPSFVSVMLRILDENGIKYKNDIVKIITPLGYAGTAAYFQKMGVLLSETEMIKIMNEYIYDEYAYKIQAKQNVVATLTELKKRGADLNILTASPHSVLDICLKRLGIYDLFNNVWSCDDFETTKSDPSIYKKVAEKLGKPVDSILFLDDNCNAGKTAKIAGMKACGVFDDSSAEYIDEIKSVADYYIYDFAELLDI